MEFNFYSLHNKELVKAFWVVCSCRGGIKIETSAKNHSTVKKGKCIISNRSMDGEKT